MESEEMLDFDTTAYDRARGERLVLSKGRAYKLKANCVQVRVHVPTKHEVECLKLRFGGGAYKHTNGWLWSISKTGVVMEIKALVEQRAPTDANTRFRALLEHTPRPDGRSNRKAELVAA